MASTVGIVWTGAREFGAALDRIVVAEELATKRAVEKVALAVVRQAKVNSTGPPRLFKEGTQGARPGTGPGVVSGRHRNSIKVLGSGPIPRGWAADVGPTMVYSRRLELGFTGTDSAGRVYDQQPYPYLRPAMEFVTRIVAQRVFREEWAKAMGA
jgi:hypothetical protein